MGEFYDARMETPGWSQPGFDDDGKWDRPFSRRRTVREPAVHRQPRNPPQGTRKKGPEEIDLGFRRPPKLEAFPGYRSVIEEIKPIAITKPAKGTYIFNLGQNFAGFVRLKVKGPAASASCCVSARCCTRRSPDDRKSPQGPRTDYYVLKGDPNGETYTPRFTFHGFQYVE
jgi:alpha-L-rhamnosidase